MSGSAGGSTVMREFLISLGFTVNETTARTFEKTIETATLKANVLADAIEAAAKAVYAATSRMADGLERLYFASQRVGSSADSFKAIGYAASQMGSSVQEAAATLEGLAQRLRTNPGYASLANSLLGGKANLQDASVLQQQLADKFKTMPYYLANVYAQAFGISETSLRAMLAGLGQFSEEYKKKLIVFGVNNDQAAASGRRFQMALRSVGSSFEILGTKIGAPLAERLAIGMRQLDQFLQRNGATIVRVINKVIDFVMGAADLVTQAIQKLGIEGVGAVAAFIAAWKLLNVTFAISPLGLILLMAAALALLYDDYETWRKGGDSLIDWTQWEPGVKQLKDGLKQVRDWFTNLDISRNQAQIGLELLLAVVVGRMVPGFVMAGRSLALALAPFLLVLNAVAAFQDVRNRGLFGNIPGQDFENKGLGRAPGTGPNGELPGANKPRSQAKEWWKRTMPSWLGGDPNFSVPVEGGPLLDAIAAGEAGGYDELYNGKKFSDFSQHPNSPQPITSGPNKGQFSTAAGRYQMLKGTWDEAAKALGLTDFSPRSQDRAAWWIAQRDYKARTGRDLLADLKSTDPSIKAGIGPALAGTWTSLPGGIEPNGATSGFNSRLGVSPINEGSYETPNLAGLNATRLGGQGATVALNQSTTINIDGARDPVAVGREVITKQANVNGDLQRNLQGAMR